MSAAKHVPGPWRPGSFSRAGRVIEDAAGNTRIAIVRAPNAELVAAAPEMFDVLCAIHDELLSRADVNQDGDGPNWAMRCLEEVERVLAKAGGQ